MYSFIDIYTDKFVVGGQLWSKFIGDNFAPIPKYDMGFGCGDSFDLHVHLDIEGFLVGEKLHGQNTWLGLDDANLKIYNFTLTLVV